MDGHSYDECLAKMRSQIKEYIDKNGIDHCIADLSVYINGEKDSKPTKKERDKFLPYIRDLEGLDYPVKHPIDIYYIYRCLGRSFGLSFSRDGMRTHPLYKNDAFLYEFDPNKNGKNYIKHGMFFEDVLLKIKGPSVGSSNSNIIVDIVDFSKIENEYHFIIYIIADGNSIVSARRMKCTEKKLIEEIKNAIKKYDLDEPNINALRERIVEKIKNYDNYTR